ncbi:uncharacterized protein A4U43_C01F12090 [Asparagus officinalis]|uniref:Uncharacterized protein n=1 Tax=Asparagus officinalis TaxID=4686 RepID=A0A5P1FPJ1_ASPOF|nr:uncharacterized protein A4U43_C01F12090 [Asparagus officinalis]
MAELRAAEQLVQLSESSAEAAAATEESCSDTPKSVNTGPPSLSVAEYEEEENIGFGGRRKNHRYRSICDLYEATSPMGVGFTKKGRRKKKGDEG